VLDPRVVDHRVAGDQGGDADAEGEPVDVGRRPPAHEEDAGGDDRDSSRLGRTRVVAERERAKQDEHRRAAARDRVHE
jgi:hypothetical protein